MCAGPVLDHLRLHLLLERPDPLRQPRDLFHRFQSFPEAARNFDSDAQLERLGPQRAKEGAYVWQKLMKSGAVVTNGTEAPVEDLSPIASFYSTVSRRTKGASAAPR